jgi:hypothetical protein
LSPPGVTDRAGSEQFARVVDLRPQPALDWEKGLAATSRAYYEVATQPAILDVVSEVLDGDVILWGASIQRRVPKAVHPCRIRRRSRNWSPGATGSGG